MSDDMDERAESFIPYKQFKPLLREGMTFADLCKAICARAGLDMGAPPGRYLLKTRPHRASEPFSTVLRSGVWIVTRAQRDADVKGRDFGAVGAA